MSQDDDTDAIASVLQARGSYTLFGRTAKLSVLMIWRSQDQRNFSVHLPDQTQQTTVFLMTDCVSQG